MTDSQSTVNPADSQSTVSPHTVDSQSAVNRQSVGSQSTVSPQSVHSQSTVSLQSVHSPSTVSLQSVYSQSRANQSSKEQGEGAWYCSKAAGSRKPQWLRVLSDAPTPDRIGQAALAAVADRVSNMVAMRSDTRLDPRYKPPLFTDSAFPLDNTSISMALPAPVEWVRARNVNCEAPETLWRQISARDIRQGSVGNCWLIAAIASAAKYPAIIKNLFHTQHLSDKGRYDLQFWNDSRGTAGAWERVTIDDFIPCRKRSRNPNRRVSKPFFATSSLEGEVWPMILEKAFVKFVSGSYHRLQGGSPIWAWRAMTGSKATAVYEQTERPACQLGKPCTSAWAVQLIDAVEISNLRWRSAGTLSSDSMFDKIHQVCIRVWIGV